MPFATPKTSDELAIILILFLLGSVFTFVSWPAWARNEISYHGRRYRRKDKPFEFWFYTTLYVSCAVMCFLFGIALSISFLRSSWRTAEATSHRHRIDSHPGPATHDENAAPSAHRHHARLPCWVHHAEPPRPVSSLQQRAVPESETHHL